MRHLIVAILFCLSLPGLAHANSSPLDGLPLNESDVVQITRIFQKHFSQPQLDRMGDFLRDSLEGRHVPFPMELKQNLRRAISDLRLDYGFQMAIILAQIKKSLPPPLDRDLEGLLQQIEQALVE